MKKRMIALLTVLTMGLAACGDNTPGQTENPVPETLTEQEGEEQLPYVASDKVKKLGEGLRTLEAPEGNFDEAELKALSGLYGKLLAETVADGEKDANVLISPSSLMMALGMCENGAAGDTLDNMEEVLGGIGVSRLNAILSGMAKRLESSDQVEWNVADSVWFKDDGRVQIKDDFVQKAQSWYDAELYMAPFDEGTLDDINGWVSDRTKGMIPTLLDSIPGDARMYLINTLAFEGGWANEYEESDIVTDQDFTNADGSKTKVDLLYSSEDSYFTVAGGKGFVRNYKGGAYSFMGLLPEEGTDMGSFVEALAEEDLAGAINNRKSGLALVRIPEFSADTDLEMSSIFKAMGMELAFDPNRADFSDMVTILDTERIDRICIGRIIHKTHIEVDRKGTKAAAASAVEMLDCAGAIEPVEEFVEICLNRPFVYGIIDNATGLPVFLGVINSL